MKRDRMFISSIPPKRCHSEAPVKLARVLPIGVPSTRGFGFARDGVIVSARVGPESALLQLGFINTGCNRKRHMDDGNTVGVLLRFTK